MRPIAEEELPHYAVLMNLTEEDFAAHPSLYECMGQYVHIYERPLDYFKFSGVTYEEGREVRREDPFLEWDLLSVPVSYELRRG